MKSLYSYVFEHFSENIFWKLDKWFENNETQYKEFIDILIAYTQHKILTPNKFKEYIENTELFSNIKEFINFIYEDKDITVDKDYIKYFQQIISFVASNKSLDNKYINRMNG